jgi:hypothetical protein
MKLSLKNSFPQILPLALFCCLSTVIQSNALQEFSSKSNSSIQSYALSESQLSALKNAPSFGFKNLIADWSFVQFLQYFGDDEARGRIGYGDSARYLSVVIHHDPYLRDFYVFLSGSSTIFAGKPEETVQVMSEGLNQLRVQRAPDSYYIWRYKGTDELLFLNDGKAAQKSFEMAANWALQSAGEEATMVAQVSQQTAQFLAENPGSHLAQINAWGSILTTALDNQTRNRAIEKIRELGGDVMMTEDGQMQITYSRAEASSDNRDI